MKTISALLLTTVLALNAAAPAQNADRQYKVGNPGEQDMIFALLDADRDGFLSDKELQNAPTVLAKLDKNGDGNLSHEELVPIKSGKGGKGNKTKMKSKGKPRN